MALHTSAWEHDVDLSGKRIGVIGTGSSGVQIVRPLAKVADHLTIFQRTPSWISPNIPEYTSLIRDEERWMLANFPGYVHCVRASKIYTFGDSMIDGRIYDIDPSWEDPLSVNEYNASLRGRMVEYIRSELAGRPELIEKVTPRYPVMARRIPQDHHWYATLLERHVELETRPIRRVVPRGVELESGEVIDLDVLVLATGYRTEDYLWPMEVHGLNGIQLSEAWSVDGPRAFLGIMVPNFPNLFCLYGPNTNPISGGPCMWGELQARFAVESIGALTRAGRRVMDVKREVFDEYNRRLDEHLRHKVWLDPRQESYYLNKRRRIITNAPWSTTEYWRWTRRPQLDDYIVR
ncbi:MAG: NAD(P)/FAD-dependent oxidoreductase [Myxococcales bacterium]|nr:NAD(P)/FAD-dependent oxidoreductase [Myxococcales bacterium]